MDSIQDFYNDALDLPFKSGGGFLFHRDDEVEEKDLLRTSEYIDAELGPDRVDEDFVVLPDDGDDGVISYEEGEVVDDGVSSDVISLIRQFKSFNENFEGPRDNNNDDLSIGEREVWNGSVREDYEILDGVDDVEMRFQILGDYHLEGFPTF